MPESVPFGNLIYEASLTLETGKKTFEVILFLVSSRPSLSKRVRDRGSEGSSAT